jgi:hypothetical protein
MTIPAGSISAFHAVMIAGGGVLIVMGVLLLLNIGGAADRAASRGEVLKQGYSRVELMIDQTRGIAPTTRAGARRLGAFLIVIIGLGIYAVLSGQ